MELLSYQRTVEWLYGETCIGDYLTVEDLDAGNYSLADIEEEAAADGVELNKRALYAWANGSE